MVLLVAINLLTGSPYWVLWVLLGWGTGILSHWFEVLGVALCRRRPRRLLGSTHHGGPYQHRCKNR